ncbi:sialidase family protein [Paenibacillus sp. FJAT-26967]|uniref:sialidase family protein n=1 Tax=Paenibacillus sp. FJAT-26967 TaxID=1729690 RepID=UPI00083955B3|nr:sialidase family protein [Paenibacillus sp. FJAT-26967]
MPNFQVNASGNPKQEPSLAVNLLDANIMIATATDFSLGPPLTGVYRSQDAGVNWTNSFLPLPPGFTGAEAAFAAYGFPNLFLIVAHVFPGDSSGTIAAYRSTDNGLSFSAPIIVNPGYGTFINNDWTKVFFDNSQSSPFVGNAYVTYNRQYNVDAGGFSVATFQRSLDGGMTWDAPLILSNTMRNTERPDVGIGLQGDLYFAWIDTTTPTAYYVRRSRDGGQTFEPSILVSAVSVVPLVLPVPGYEFRVLTCSNIVADTALLSPGRGNIYAVWQDYRQGYADVFLSRSQDQGLTWSPPIPITASPAGAQNFFPAITVSPKTGTITVVYYTNRLNGFDLDVYAAQSRDGGSTFVNFRVTTTSFNPNGDSPIPTPLIGDYIDVGTVVPDNFYAVWTDTRTGSQTTWGGF